jgi:hypothetical protein
VGLLFFKLRFVFSKRGTNDKHANAAAQGFVDAAWISTCKIATDCTYLRRSFDEFLIKAAPQVLLNCNDSVDLRTAPLRAKADGGAPSEA